MMPQKKERSKRVLGVIVALVSFHCAKLISVKFRRVTASLRFRFVQTEIFAGPVAMSYVCYESLTGLFRACAQFGVQSCTDSGRGSSDNPRKSGGYNVANQNAPL